LELRAKVTSHRALESDTLHIGLAKRQTGP
jgi:hypothetical protein